MIRTRRPPRCSPPFIPSFPATPPTPAISCRFRSFFFFHFCCALFANLLSNQALRHFYALAARPACVVARDAETHRPLRAAVSLNASPSQLSPCIFGKPLAENDCVVAACEGFLPAAVRGASLPLTVFLQPLFGKRLAEFDWEKWWRDAVARKCGSHSGWSVSISAKRWRK
jgi:hypothetical protein